MAATPPQSDLNRKPPGPKPRASYLVGLIGRGIQASKSPTMHRSEAAAQGFELTYELLDFDQRGLPDESLPEVLNEAERRGFAGLNITYPYKQRVLPLLHDLSPEAQAIGAVNTIQLRDGRRIGYNTDASGFEESFRRGMPGAALNSVVQVGGGGAGAATAFAFLRLGVQRLTIVDIALERAHALATDLQQRFPEREVRAAQDLREIIAGAEGVLNATPLGMATHPGSAVPADLLRPSLWVADIVYFPIVTRLLSDARALGCRTLDGSGMVIFQAARAFELFTGRAADGKRMQRHFETVTGE
jgi:shikimate dehydrogenase